VRSNYPVWLLRMITSCEIKRRADFFAPFIMVSKKQPLAPASFAFTAAKTLAFFWPSQLCCLHPASCA